MTVLGRTQRDVSGSEQAGHRFLGCTLDGRTVDADRLAAHDHDLTRDQTSSAGPATATGPRTVCSRGGKIMPFAPARSSLPGT
ncbi:hypothetical protein [Streptomyces cylindrosporus]|uniref:Uncharacterized protein n=1 Tax=Streptomyces cylindrosporus TaxID=2927583 RepID=A0ABS9YI84_9ACTN|nr:hypothetical protein [Streptomyces cylindrosporus]MCI3276952.1 hypothetical protein [Streptomyces cylindrosporus]